MNAPQESSDDWIVEVSSEIADRAEEVLREFATDAELDLAMRRFEKDCIFLQYRDEPHHVRPLYIFP